MLYNLLNQETILELMFRLETTILSDLVSCFTIYIIFARLQPSIWICPRGTIRQIVDNDPDKYVIILLLAS